VHDARNRDGRGDCGDGTHFAAGGACAGAAADQSKVLGGADSVFVVADGYVFGAELWIDRVLTEVSGETPRAKAHIFSPAFYRTTEDVPLQNSLQFCNPRVAALDPNGWRERNRLG